MLFTMRKTYVDYNPKVINRAKKKGLGCGKAGTNAKKGGVVRPLLLQPRNSLVVRGNSNLFKSLNDGNGRLPGANARKGGVVRPLLIQLRNSLLVNECLKVATDFFRARRNTYQQAPPSEVALLPPSVLYVGDCEESTLVREDWVGPTYGTLTFIFLLKGFEKKGNSKDAENGRVYEDYWSSGDVSALVERDTHDKSKDLLSRSLKGDIELQTCAPSYVKCKSEEEHSIGDLNEPTSYKAAMLDSKSNKWIDAMNAENINP
ncbi:hypothetical protein Tco_0424811 [Tanacetum coccineum]